MDVEVIYPYEPLQDDELCLKVGDIINQVDCIEKGWCKGVLNKVSGVFPDNFVRLVTNNKKRIPPHDTSEMKPPSVEKREFGGRRCRVVFSYVPQHEDELTLNEGDVIDIMQEVEEGWWKGLLNGKVGMFPSNFVEVCEQNDETPSNIYTTEPRNDETNDNLYNSAETSVPAKKDLNGTAVDLHSSPNSAFHPVQPAKDNKDDTDGAAKSCLRANGHEPPSKISKMQANAIEKERQDCFNEMDKITINIREGKHKDIAKNASSAKSIVEHPQVSPPQLPPKPVRELARVLYPYPAEHDDELDLCEGETITILCKDLEDKGWWRGEISGKIGVFPDNFVKIISSEELHIKPPRPEKRPSSTPNKLSPPTTPNHSPISNLLQEKDQTQPPPLPSKKVAPPPPPAEKKPLHNDADESSHSGPNSFNHLNQIDEGSLTLTRETPLSHVTRPKGPNRRPPSQFIKDQKASTTQSDNDQSSDDEQVPLVAGYSPGDKGIIGHLNGSLPASEHAAPTSSPTAAEANHVPWLKELRENQKKKRLSEFLVPGETEMGAIQPSSTSSTASTPITKITPSTPGNPKSSPPYSTKPQLSSTLKNILANPIPHMREDIKANKSPQIAPTPAVRPHDGASSLTTSMIQESFKKEANGVVDGLTLTEKVDVIFKEFIPKIRSLESKVEELQVIHSRQIKVLTKDLDDERKQRACLQIEVDRLKKLFTTGYAQV